MRKNEIGLTSEEHQGGRGREVGRRRPPASDDPGREGHEHEEEGHDEEGDVGGHPLEQVPLTLHYTLTGPLFLGYLLSLYCM